jgi:paraquat-inducible protein A
MHPDEFSLQCPLCGQQHAARSLRRGQRALCVRCGATMMERGWTESRMAMAFALSGLFLALPALALPFVTLQQFGHVRTTHVTVGFTGLWAHGFSSLGAWVLLCGTLAPIGLLLLIVVILSTDGRAALQAWNRRLRRLAAVVEYWAMPEVQVLGVMVAFLKLGSVVTVTVGPGLWCYGAVALCLLVAWRRFSLHPDAHRAGLAPGEAGA